MLRSSTIIKYIFNSFLYSKCSLNKKLLNIYLIEVHERDNDFKRFFSFLHFFMCIMLSLSTPSYNPNT